jgi:GT2 family glycosyltransferase
MKHSTLSLIIIAHNKADVSALCLKSLLQVTYHPLQIVFVNNGSRDHTATVLAQYAGSARAAGIDFEVITLRENQGAIVPRNIAIRRCRGQWIGFLDNDVIIRSRNVFDQLVSFLSGHPEVGVVSPKFVYPCPPYLIQCAGGGITREGNCYLIGRGAERDRLEYNITTPVAWTISACMIMPAALVREMGPLDEVFHPVGFEDTDYCLRARVRRKDVIYFPYAELYHIENTTTFGTKSIKMEKIMKRNQRIFRRKWSHMFPPAPSLKDLPLAHSCGPKVPLWAIGSLPVT